MIFPRFFYTNDLKLKNLFLGALLCLSLFSCQKEDSNVIPQTDAVGSKARTEDTQSEVFFNGEYLEFKNQADFDSLVKALESKNETELNIWEQSLPKGFISLRNIYQQAQRADYDYVNQFLRVSGFQLLSLKQQNQFHSPFVKKHINSFVFEDNGSFRMNIFKREFGVLTNKEGLVLVSGNLLQFTDKYVKVLRGANKEKIEKLKTAIKDDIIEGIFVNPVTDITKSMKNGRAEYSFQAWDDSFYPGIYRVRWAVSLRRYSMPKYDYNDPNYQACIDDAAKTGRSETHCQAPIVGWLPISSDYYCEAWHEKNTLKLGWQFPQRQGVFTTMNITCTINGQVYNYSFNEPTGYMYQNLNNSKAIIEVTNACHTFKWNVINQHALSTDIIRSVCFQ